MAEPQVMEPSAPSEPTMADMLALLHKQSAEIEALKAGQTQFVPMKRPERPAEGGYRPPAALEPRTLVRKAGDEARGQSNIYDDPTYRNELPPQFRPAFTVGSFVRINPDAPQYGTVTEDNPAGKPWGEVLGRRVETVGEVLATLGRRRSFEPKYRVHFQGITGRNGDGYLESELLPA